MSLVISDDIVKVSGLSEREFLIEVVIMLFEQDKISLGKASELLEMHRMQFQTLLAESDICIHYDVTEFQEDLKNLAGNELLMIIVSNTSPISNLAKVGHLTLLQKLYNRILIPSAVHHELLDERAGETVITAVQAANWLRIQPVQNQQLVSQLQSRVNVGEAEAIALAIEVNASRLLIDERLGRQVAASRGLKITGVLGILLAAKRQGAIAMVKPIMDNLVTQASFRISSQLYAEVLKAANE